MGAIARRELLSLFVSPLAWTVLAVTQALLAYVFLRLLQAFAQSQGQLQALPGAPGLTRLVAMPLFEVTAFVLMLTVPLITMRSFAEERRAGTLTLLLSAPASSGAIVLGKYLGTLGFVLGIVALAAAMPASLLIGASLDPGLMASGLLGLTLLAAAFTAVGLYLSALTAQPTVAAVSTFGVLLFGWLLEWGAERDGVIAYLSVLKHLRALLRGVVDTQNVAFFLLVAIAFIVLAVRRLDAERSAL